MPFSRPIATLVCLVVGQIASAQIAANRGTPWHHHSIDNSARGADGVRLADANGDGLPDIATGWEEAGLIRLYLNPRPKKAKTEWPAVTVGRVSTPEDAVLVDLDGDGGLDIVSCCEGHAREVNVHWAPRNKSRLLDSTAWTTASFPAVAGQLAMYCLPLQIDGKRGVDLVIGSKAKGARIGWLQSPADPRDLGAWQYHPLCTASWIMSLVATDMDGDGDSDILASDRRGKTSGCLWLENPGQGEAQTQPWNRHAIGPAGVEVMFLHHIDFDADGHRDILVPTAARQLYWFRRSGEAKPTWEVREIPFPDATGIGKGVRAADMDLDGRLDLVVSTVNYVGTSGLVWMSSANKPASQEWQTHEISGLAGPKGLKFDDIQTIDLDADGDLDVLTTEERTGFGVVWFENPIRP